MVGEETTLKIKRTEQGLTQKQVAQKAKITTRGYQYVEAGKRLPKADTAILIADILNSTVEELFRTE